MPTLQTTMNRKNSKPQINVTINDTNSPIEDNSPDPKSGNFEDAIKATGYGKFNVVLVCIIIPGSFAQIVEQTSLGYVNPIAQCDLNLSLEDKGLLVAITYAGMIFSSFMWGYICDTYGRRKIVIYGYSLSAVCYLTSAFSQNFIMLLITKFISGFIFTGPFSAVTSYLSEFHSTANRSRIQLMRGVASSLAVIILPFVAWGILPNTFEITITESIKLHSWNFFIVICCVPALMTGIIFIFMPESPKYLMSSGQKTKALSVFKQVYRTNTGKRISTFPIDTLVEEKVEPSAQNEPTLKGIAALKPLFQPPHLLRLAHACLNAMVMVLGAFGVKLWYPQILQAINDYKSDSESINVCNVVNSLASQNTTTGATCTVNIDNSSVYINAATQGVIQLVCFSIAGLAVGKTGKKPLLLVILIVAACCPVLIYFIPNATIMLVLFPVIVAFSEICGNLFMATTMEMFPTAFRLTALNTHMMFARIGIVTGNVVLPSLLKAGCIPTLSFITISMLASAVLTSLLPNTDNKALD